MTHVAKYIQAIPSYVAIFCILFYRSVISPVFPSCCRFVPTCSEYGLIAFKRFGFIQGFKLTFKRILRCHPGGSYGYDPVPEHI
ncbi:MAG: membrane protein insertion efficiency factor YidD [Eggerthellaceae bacterium]|jgi:putative membrane protein insertion efficiency factor|nr:membrane protein insertion efficiency factor YidD [Eggerthellaceae bacterium]